MRFIPRGNLRECLDVDMMSLQHAQHGSVNEEGAMVTQHQIEIRENVNVSN